jgi:hypothetical protein
MKDPFKNPLAPKQRTSSSTFIAPTKEQATTGMFMRAGDDYGLGFKEPIGKIKATKGMAVPQESKCIDPNSIL